MTFLAIYFDERRGDATNDGFPRSSHMDRHLLICDERHSLILLKITLAAGKRESAG